MSDFTKLIKELEAKSLSPFPACLQEWQCTGYEHCGLKEGMTCACGKHIAHVFEITNIYTDKRIDAIGSTCVKKFEPEYGQGLIDTTKDMASCVRRARAAAVRAAGHAELAIEAAERMVDYCKHHKKPVANLYAHVAKWTCFFKKHKGKKWGDLIISERGYCSWLLHMSEDKSTSFTLHPQLFHFLKAAISTQCERA